MTEVIKNTDINSAKMNHLAIAANDALPHFARPRKRTDLSKSVKKRMADLKWQIQFTQIQLNRWHALENGRWTSLKSLQKSAKLELQSLMLQ